MVGVVVFVFVVCEGCVVCCGVDVGELIFCVVVVGFVDFGWIRLCCLKFICVYSEGCGVGCLVGDGGYVVGVVVFVSDGF